MRALITAMTLFLFLPLTAWSDCAVDCLNSCGSVNDSGYESCMVSCLQSCQKYDPPSVPDVPPPTPVEQSN